MLTGRVSSLDATVVAGGVTVESLIGFAAAEELPVLVVAAGEALAFDDGASAAANVGVVVEADGAVVGLFVGTLV